MKKLLTLILPALVLTAGAPQAAKAEGYLWGAAVRGSNVQVEPYRKASRYFFAFSTGHKTKEEALRGAKAKCYETGATPESCSTGPAFSTAPITEVFQAEIEHSGEYAVKFFQKNYPNGVRCMAYTHYEEGGRAHSPLTQVGGSKEEAIEKSLKECNSYEAGPCRLVVAACADDGVTQVADAASPAPVEADEPPAQQAREQDKARYGAVAVTAERTAYALAVGYATQREADQAAYNLCTQQRRGGESFCPAATAINAPCAAIAKVNDGTDAPIGAAPGHIWEPGLGSGDDKAGATETAIADCQGQHGRPTCSLHSAVCAPAERPASMRGRLDKTGEEAVRDIKGYIENLVGQDQDAPANKEATE